LKKLRSLVKVPPLQVAVWCDRTTSHPPRAAIVWLTNYDGP